MEAVGAASTAAATSDVPLTELKALHRREGNWQGATTTHKTMWPAKEVRRTNTTSRVAGNRSGEIVSSMGAKEARVKNSPKRRIAPADRPPKRSGEQEASPGQAKIAFLVWVVRRFELHIVNADGSNHSRLKDDISGMEYTWSPDGRTILCQVGAGRRSSIHAINTRTRQVKDLSNHPGGAWSPNLSPDGTRIAFVSIARGNPDIHIMKADGSDIRNISNSRTTESGPSWSPDGKRIAYHARGGQASDIHVMRSDGSNPLRLPDTAALRHEMSWSPDSRQIVYAAPAARHADSPTRNCFYSELWVAHADGTGSRKLTRILTDDEGDSDPSWSPDGSMIVFSRQRIKVEEIRPPAHSGKVTSYSGEVRESGIFVIRADGTGMERLTDGRLHATYPSWAPDGRILFSTGKVTDGDHGLHLMNPDGSGKTKVFGSANAIHRPKAVAGHFELEEATDPAGTGPEGDSEQAAGQPAQASILAEQRTTGSAGDASDDPGRIAFVSGRDGNPEIYVINADGSGRRRLTQNDQCDGLRFEHSVMDSNGMGKARSYLPSHHGALLWSPDGEKLVFKSGRASFTCMNLAGGDQRKVGGGDYACFSPDGKRMAFVGSSTIYVVNDDGRTQKALKPGWRPVFLPDGKRMVCGSELSGFDGIYLVTTDGRSITRLTPTDSKCGGHSLSPDGKQIAFNSGRDGNQEIYFMNVDGSGMERLTRHPGRDCYPRWSPDGKWIAFNSNRRGDFEIYTVRTDGKELTNVTRSPGNDWLPSWSPDSRQLAFESDRDGNFEVYAVNADGSEPRRLTDNPAWDGNPVWSPSRRSTQANRTPRPRP